MKIAFVYDRVNKFGGAERVLLALHQIWPKAPLYTAVYDQKRAKWAKIFRIIHPNFRLLTLLGHRQELFPFIAPYIFESFNLEEYDIVLSVTSSDAKCVVTKPSTLHVCYCLTPTRYLWSSSYEYLSHPGVGVFNPLVRLGMKLLFHSMRKWDYISSSRPDHYLSISQRVSDRIRAYYRHDAPVIYPPIDTDTFKPVKSKSEENFYLIVSRLVPYKRIDYAIDTFNKLGWNLKIIGDGIDDKRLRHQAKNNVQFIKGNLTDQNLCWYYQNCQALIYPGEEDFGITAVEAQACGRPVIAYSASGVKETVIDGVTGIMYRHQNDESLTDALKKFKKSKIKSAICRKNALRYSKATFQRKMKEAIFNLWHMHKSKL